MDNAAIMPADRNADLSSDTWPANTITGIASGRAAAAIAPTTFPCRDCSSNRPSPVTISSASARSSAKCVCSAMIAAPDWYRPPTASSPAPIPPAACARLGAHRARRPRQFNRPCRQTAFQHCDGGHVRALLRREHPGRAPWSQQWVFDIRGGDHLDVGQLSAGRVQAAKLGNHPLPPSVHALPPTPPRSEPPRPAVPRR